MGIFTKTAGYFKDRLSKTRDKISTSLSSVLSLGRNIDEVLLDKLEETLISDDIGVETTDKLITELERSLSREKTCDDRRDSSVSQGAYKKLLACLRQAIAPICRAGRRLSSSPASTAQARPRASPNWLMYSAETAKRLSWLRAIHSGQRRWSS